jgi:hypothetical protein
MYPRDNDWKKLITKHKRAIDDFRNNNKDLPSKVEDELLTWASQTGEVSGKHDAEDFILDILDENLDEVSQKAMIQKAIDIATSMGGNMTGAVKRIEKIKRGLSKDKNVANALRLANESYFPKINVAFKEDLDENYRTAARNGMGTEGKKEARVGLELDYYDKEGVKHMGKIVKKDSKGYTVKDDKTGKTHTFVYHDRVKAKKFLQKMGDNLGEGGNPAQQAAIAISKKEKAGKPGYDKEGKSLKKESVMNSYRQMWEDALDEEMITYRVKGMQKPEMDKFKGASRMGLKVSFKKSGSDTHVTLTGTKKNLRDFDSVARGKSSYGDPSTITHFDEK